MTFTADYPGAIVLEANKYGYNGKPGIRNLPAAWCLHTPEEPADDYPSTPWYLHGTDRDASVHYFVSYYGFVWQLVPEKAGAYANAVEGKPYPQWANSNTNLNLQTLSIEIEGYANSIHQTMPRGSSQWNALVSLISDRCKAYGFPVERTFGHVSVSVNRSDPGQLDIQAIIEDVNNLLKPPARKDVKLYIRYDDPNSATNPYEAAIFVTDGSQCSAIYSMELVPGKTDAEKAANIKVLTKGTHEYDLYKNLPHYFARGNPVA